MRRLNYPASIAFIPVSLHDALPISIEPAQQREEVGRRLDEIAGARQPLHLGEAGRRLGAEGEQRLAWASVQRIEPRSEEHTSELQSRFELVCRLLLENKKTESGDPT